MQYKLAPLCYLQAPFSLSKYSTVQATNFDQQRTSPLGRPNFEVNLSIAACLVQLGNLRNF